MIIVIVQLLSNRQEYDRRRLVEDLNLNDITPSKTQFQSNDSMDC